MKGQLFVLFVLGLIVYLNASKLIPTPFGLRPEICVTRGLPSGSRIEEVEDGINIHHPSGDIQKLPKHQECIDFHNNWMVSRGNRTRVGSTLDGWLDDASWTPPYDINSFTGYYQVPDSPPNGSGQILFYFIGVQNFQSNYEVTILQPVLTWGNGLNGWSYASWNCCPAGQQQESNPFQGFGPGDELYAAITPDNYGNWVITSSWPDGGQATTLTVADDSRTFDWACVTLETYDVSECDQFPNGPMYFFDMGITLDYDGYQDADWTDNTGNTECGGSLSIDGPNQISVQHNPYY
eukprot:TRINITY_DN5584_c0_g1_i1.p1 TRINITY_DN5584_c0_g1~~TRINITY_DN5584_c0_g1_i1.p1  ORF type:complete len:306 (-),score=42.73 TRINITY_DN5584_c0_g1_i1:188-1069(-)